MTETSEGSKVYQIKFESLDAYENYQFKFAANVHGQITGAFLSRAQLLSMSGLTLHTTVRT